MSLTNDLSNYAAIPVQGFRNKIINGNFDYWQRLTSTSTSGYNADKWITNNTGSTFTSSRQSFTLGQTSVPYEPTYWHRTVVTTSAGASNGVVVRQCMESVRTLAGQTATLSFWAKADASKNIAVEFSQIFGTGGSPSSAVTTIGVTTCALTTSWTKYTVTVNIPSISGKTLGSNNDDYLELRFWFDAGSSFNSRTNSLGQRSGTFDIAQVQLETGSIASIFEIRHQQIEFALCQRYYQNIGGSGGWNGTPYTRVKDDVNVYYGSIYLPVNMRAAPTITPTVVSGSNLIHKPWIRWDTVSSWNFSIFLTNRVDVDITPANDDGSTSNILFIYGYTLVASADY